jgi:hypothetical protein
MEWSDDIENILENIRINSVVLSSYHKERYYHYKGHLKYFKLPLIILSSITSIASVGLNGYINQSTVSLTTCLLSLTSAILASIELYLGIQKNMEQELIASKNFQLLSYNIYKVLSLERDHRVEKGRLFLDEIYNEYIKLIENSNLIKNKKLKDALAEIPKLYILSSKNTTPKNEEINFGLELHQLGENNV